MLFDQIYNFGLFVDQNYRSLYLRILSKEFFQTLKDDRIQ